MVYLIEKGRIPASRFTQIIRMTRQPGEGLVEIAVRFNCLVSPPSGSKVNLVKILILKKP